MSGNNKIVIPIVIVVAVIISILTAVATYTIYNKNEQNNDNESNNNANIAEATSDTDNNNEADSNNNESDSNKVDLGQEQEDTIQQTEVIEYPTIYGEYTEKVNVGIDLLGSVGKVLYKTPQGLMIEIDITTGKYLVNDSTKTGFHGKATEVLRNGIPNGEPVSTKDTIEIHEIDTETGIFTLDREPLMGILNRKEPITRVKISSQEIINMGYHVKYDKTTNKIVIWDGKLSKKVPLRFKSCISNDETRNKTGYTKENKELQTILEITAPGMHEHVEVNYIRFDMVEVLINTDKSEPNNTLYIDIPQDIRNLRVVNTYGDILTERTN